MDLLEHVEVPAKVIAEASRVLKPGGLFFFHTFNRNWFSWLFALKGVEWFGTQHTPQIFTSTGSLLNPARCLLILNAILFKFLRFLVSCQLLTKNSLNSFYEDAYQPISRLKLSLR